MPLNNFERELEQLEGTYANALEADVCFLKSAIASTSESSLIGVGSGGSYTVASMLCNLHESLTGRVSRPSTPLEIICNPTLASSSPVFIISAEGKNPDIVEALERARRHSSRSIHVLTNRSDSPLMSRVRSLPGITPHVFELANKDGYLATNSLLMDAVLVARAYGAELGSNQLSRTIGGLLVGGRSLRPDTSGYASTLYNQKTTQFNLFYFEPSKGDPDQYETFLHEFRHLMKNNHDLPNARALVGQKDKGEEDADNWASQFKSGKCPCN